MRKKAHGRILRRESKEHYPSLALLQKNKNSTFFIF